jgi:hypothetical protein
MGQPNSKYTTADIKRERSHFRRGLAKRIREYAKEVEQEDRRSAPQIRQAWEEARSFADEMLADLTEVQDVDQDLEALLNEFRRHDRGESTR